MAVKTVEIEGIGLVKLQKRRGTRHLRISLTPDGSVRVGMPTWVPFQAGITFAREHESWIKRHIVNIKPMGHLQSGDRIGKAHTIYVIQSPSTSRPRATVLQNQIRIHAPATIKVESDLMQSAIKRGALQALQKEATQLLPQRLAYLAAQQDFTYKKVRLKPMKSRWGSCDQFGNITLNIYLMQLSWNLIDYVLLHELTHTQIHNHGQQFWNRLDSALPGAKNISKRLKAHQPTLEPVQSVA